MRTFLGDIFTFIVERGEILFLIISLAVLIEGLLYLFFPQKMKKTIEKCPLFFFRVLGGLVIIFGLTMLYLYIEILSPIFLR